MRPSSSVLSCGTFVHPHGQDGAGVSLARMGGFILSGHRSQRFPNSGEALRRQVPGVFPGGVPHQSGGTAEDNVAVLIVGLKTTTRPWADGQSLPRGAEFDLLQLGTRSSLGRFDDEHLTETLSRGRQLKIDAWEHFRIRGRRT